MPVATTLKKLDAAEAEAELRAGAALVDLRAVERYLEGHLHGSLSLAYEAGPGFASRARDCLPLHLELIVIDDEVGELMGVAAALRGKGYDVLGSVERAATASWRQESTDVLSGVDPLSDYVLDVGDPGARAASSATHIPLDRLWGRAEKLAGRDRIVVAAGRGVRAALAVGILERAGVGSVAFWWAGG